MNQDCLDQIRIMYQLYTGADIADAIKIVRAEMTAEEQRTRAKQMAEGMRIGMDAENKKHEQEYDKQKLMHEKEQKQPKE
jgi:pilus assembly protein TadC